MHRGERSHRENSIDLSHGLREKETELLDGNGRRDCTDKSGRGGRERERVSREEWERTGGGGEVTGRWNGWDIVSARERERWC